MKKKIDFMSMEDREANVFALCLLMPEDMLARELVAIGGCDIEDEKELTKLAGKFRVSPCVMAFRLGQLFGERRHGKS